jgi:voltage-gated potassium channel
MAIMNKAIYYSFVCLTTTGYGDIAPISELTRMLSILESLTGQLYLAILVARLVGLQVAQAMTVKD